MAYAPFGEEYVGGGGIERLFTGVVRSDQDPAIFRFPARQYHTSEGRWLSPDPASLDAFALTNPQTLNRYAYVANNPLSNVDPTGLEDCASLGNNCVIVDGGSAPGVDLQYLFQLIGSGGSFGGSTFSVPATVTAASLARAVTRETPRPLRRKSHVTSQLLRPT